MTLHRGRSVDKRLNGSGRIGEVHGEGSDVREERDSGGGLLGRELQEGEGSDLWCREDECECED